MSNSLFVLKEGSLSPLNLDAAGCKRRECFRKGPALLMEKELMGT